MINNWIIHFSQKRDLPWAIAPVNKQGDIQFAEKVFIDVPSQTYEDYEGNSKTWCYVLAQGKLEWSGKVARIVGG
jgi:hypothetical protein